MKKIIKIIRLVLSYFNIGLIKLDQLKELQANRIHDSLLKMLINLPKKDAQKILQYIRKSKSQLGQDLFVLSELGFKRNGFFVEFGAANGIDLSNTYLLEKDFGWNGVLAEPARCWHKELNKNRGVNIDTCCIWTTSDSMVTFKEVDYAELSTISLFTSKDANRNMRLEGKTYAVKTLTLNDLLKKYNSPSIIDYLSIDTEGSEFDILESLDFNKYQFRVITCEHNFTADREKIFELLKRNGYVRKFEDISSVDDWYFNDKLSTCSL